jgi:Fe-S-cluster containining protein
MMEVLEPIFEKYESLVAQVDEVFDKVRREHPNCVKCKLECSDCCHALFDLSLVESLYINRHFLKKAVEARRAEIIDKANRIDRKVYQVKRKAYKAVQSGVKSEEQVLLEMAAERIRCPLLNDDNLCDLYEHRPVTCRLYGIPTSIGGRGHTCGLSGFEEGVSYPTVNLDAINAKLHELSREVVAVLRSKHVKMGDLLMPLSMALLTVFDEEYLGLASEQEEDKEKQE